MDKYTNAPVVRLPHSKLSWASRKAAAIAISAALAGGSLITAGGAMASEAADSPAAPAVETAAENTAGEETTAEEATPEEASAEETATEETAAEEVSSDEAAAAEVSAEDTSAVEEAAEEDALPEVAEGYTRHTYADGAYIDIPNEWKRGTDATITGGNYLGTAGDPSVISIKLNRGSLAPAQDSPSGFADVWAEVTADADGNVNFTLPFPTPENSNLTEELAEGAEITFFALTGSLGKNDIARGGAAGTSTVTGAIRPANIDQPKNAVCEWDFSDVKTVETGSNNGYQLALNRVTKRAYFSDASWHQQRRNEDGTIETVREATGKLVEFDTETGEKLRDIDFTHLNHWGKDTSDASDFDWENFDGDSQTSMRLSFAPYGVAVDESNNTVISTTARQRGEAGYGGGLVMWTATQDGPTNDDRISEYPDGTPVLHAPRRLSVNPNTNRAFAGNMGDGRFGREGRSGYVTVLDTTKRGIDAVVAQIEVPQYTNEEGTTVSVGVIDVVADPVNNNIYVGTIGAGEERLWVIDGDKIVESDPRTTSREESWAQNADAITKLEGEAGLNARLSFDARNQVVYSNEWKPEDGTITKFDANPESETFGHSLGRIITGATNATAVDPARGLLYSANLGDQEVVVFDSGDLSIVGRIPTAGNALNLYVDLDGTLWISNFADNGKAHIVTPKPADENTDCIVGDPQPLPNNVAGDDDQGDDNQGAGDDNQGAGDDNQGAGDDNQGAGDDNQGAGDDNQDAGDDNQDAGDDNQDAGDDNQDAGDDNQGAGDDKSDVDGEDTEDKGDDKSEDKKDADKKTSASSGTQGGAAASGGKSLAQTGATIGGLGLLGGLMTAAGVGLTKFRRKND